MTKKNILASSGGAVVLLGGIALFAFAQSPPPPAPQESMKLHMEVKDNGRVLVRGAKITSVATSTINAATTWEGGASISWVIMTDGSTEHVRYHGGPGSFSELAVGHTISFSGWLVPGPSLTVRADVVRDWSVTKERINSLGVIQSINAAAKSFVLATEERGNLTVLTSGATEILKGKATTTFAALKVGDRARVLGLWDRNANTLQAERIKIFVEDRRVFEGGKLKSLSATTTPPTSMVVTFGRMDYTVNIESDTAVLNRLWVKVPLSAFRIGHHIRVYGVADGTTIDASVVRNMDLR